MKILALGALWVPYIRDNWFDALNRVKKEEVVCVNAGPLIGGKDKYTGQPEGFHSAYIYDILRREKFDYLFFYHDWIFGDYPDAFFEKVRRSGVKTIAFHPDDEPEHWYARNIQYDHHYDLVASHSKAGAERRYQSGWLDRVLYLPWGYNPRTCYRIDHSFKRYDVVFIGKHKVYDHDISAHVEDGEQREQILLRLAEVCDQKGWIFKLFGYGWDKHKELSKYAGGIPSQQEMVEIMNSTKIVFNPAWSSDGSLKAVQTKLRHFEVPGCGAFQITNENPELAELFRPDEEVVFFNSDEELLEKVAYYIKHDAEREAIADAGYKRALKQHTLDIRVQTLFQHASSLYPETKQLSVLMPAIKQLPLNNIGDLIQLDRRIQAGEDVAEGCAWVHIIAGDFYNLSINYRSLLPFFQLYSDDILGINTYVDYEGLAANPLQPKLIERYGCVLSNDLNTDDFDFELLQSEKGNFLGVQSEGKAELLVNFLAPTGRLQELLAAFLHGSYDAVQQLNAVATARIVTEVQIRLPEDYQRHPIEGRTSEYARRLRALLPKLATQKLSIAVYGISGMGEVALRLIGQVPGLNVVAIVDRSLQVKSFRGIPVIKPEDLNQVLPNILILTAGASGPSLYASLEYLEGSVCILPLYDLNHPVWDILPI